MVDDENYSKVLLYDELEDLYNPNMKKRFVLAVVFACCALIVLVVRYLPPHASAHNLGDPADHAVGASFMILDHGYDGLIRRSFVPARFNIPLADGRGAHSASVRVGVEPAAALVMHVHQQYLVVDVKDTIPRTYHTLVPQATSRWVSITLSPPTGSSVVVDHVAAIGRAGWPPLLDLLVLMAVACVPALLMVITARWPLDWAVLPSLVALLYFVLLPRDELGDVMAFGPLVALCVGCVGTVTYARARPAITLLLLIGAGLRLYALGWGGGYPFHPEEQALAAGAGEGMFARAVYVTTNAWSPTTTSPWTLVLVGRLYSAILGILLIAVVYALGRQLLRQRWALLAATFVAVAPMLVQQSHIGAGTQAVTLLVALLMLFSTMLLNRMDVRTSMSCLVVSSALVLGSPPSFIWLTAPLITLVMMRQQVRHRLLLVAPLLTLLLFGVSRWANNAVAASVAASNVQGDAAMPSYIYPLFNILLWGLGPLLMQIGVVGWGVACASGIFGDRRVGLDRRWFPLLWSTFAAFAVAGKGPQYSLVTLTPFVPMLSLTGALLLQMFSYRLRFAFGRRTVRLLAGTAFTLALATSIGLLNMYRKPDQRIAASRWLVAHLDRDKTLLSDATISDTLPLGVASAYRTATLRTTDTPAVALKQYALTLSQTTHIVTTAARMNISTSDLRHVDPLMACTYIALFDGRLGFVERAAFTAQPHIGSWIIDNRRADRLIRGADHSDIHIYERVVSLPPEAIEQALRCSFNMEIVPDQVSEYATLKAMSSPGMWKGGSDAGTDRRTDATAFTWDGFRHR